MEALAEMVVGGEVHAAGELEEFVFGSGTVGQGVGEDVDFGGEGAELPVGGFSCGHPDYRSGRRFWASINYRAVIR